jgi:hypothetical protein
MASMYTDCVSSKVLLQKKQKLVALKKDLAVIETLKADKIARQKRQFGVLSAMAFAFFSAQFSVGYHCIYNVEWLGWDLVEPLTYTVS